MVGFDRLAALEASGVAGVLITVVEARGSTPRKPGARLLITDDGRLEGTVGGGAVEHAALAAAAEVRATGQSRLLEVHLGQDLGMCCGGSMRLFLERLTPKPPFILLGAGHVARACAPLLASLGFAVHVADGREGFAVADAFPPGTRLHDGVDPSDLDGMPFGQSTHVLVATHDHGLDQRLVEGCLRRPWAWLGLLASRRKALRTRERCLHKGFTEEEIGRLTSPVGLRLGGQTPQEIAVSLAAELVHRRHLGPVPATGVPALALALGSRQPTDVDAPREAAPAKATGS